MQVMQLLRRLARKLCGKDNTVSEMSCSVNEVMLYVLEENMVENRGHNKYENKQNFKGGNKSVA